jgi:hypothetical protein
MKKNITVVLITLLCTSGISSAQVDQDVLKTLRSRFSNIDVYELIFLENELISLCQDSIGQDLVVKRLGDLKQSFASMQIFKARTELIALKLLATRIKKCKPNNKDQRDSKKFLESRLQDFKVDFTINEKMVSELFDHKKRDIASKAPCDVGISMYVIFVYDSQLYLKFFENKNANSGIFFPLKCTITEYDRAISIRRKMQKGLLDILESYKGNREFNKVYKDISKAILDGSYD